MIDLRQTIRTVVRGYLNENANIPNVLYHASNELFDNFELKQGYRTHLVSVEKTDAYAIFLTDDIEATKEYGERYLYKCKINANRVLDWTEDLDVRSYEWFIRNFGNIIPWNASEYWMLLDDKRVIDYLKHRGIDCVMITEIGEQDQFTTYAVLNPNNIQILDVFKLK
jgi:hypothetical protein